MDFASIVACKSDIGLLSMFFSYLCFIGLLTLCHAQTVLVAGDTYHKSSNGIYYYIPNVEMCPSLYHKGSKSKSKADLKVSQRDLSIHLMPEYQKLCFSDSKKDKKKKNQHKLKNFAGCKGDSCSAVATLYNLIPGGGEKYLLSIVRAMQKLEQTVDIIVLPGNTCRTKDCVTQTAKAVNVQIDWKHVNVVVMDISNSYFRSYLPHYNYFASLGNEKIPVISAIGDMNFYMNQFPFDLDRRVSKSDAQILSTYDWVVFNSKYTLGWFNHYISHSAVSQYGADKILPQPVVVYPPVTVSKANTEKVPRKPWIVMTGRFFEGVQSKHHHDALETFRILKQKLPTKQIRLYLLGFQMPGNIHTAYTASVKSLAAEIGDVYVLVNAKHQEIKSIISQATVAWSMTGGFDYVENPAHNPADAEHFGISVLEAMSAGCIPVVVGRGGLVEIVDGDASLMCQSTKDCASKTLHILKSKGDVLATKIAWAQSRPSYFSDEVFDKQIAKAFASGGLSPVNQLIRRGLRSQNPVVSSKSPYAAVIVETRSSIMLKSVVSEHLKMLGSEPEWRLVVLHGRDNGDYCRDSLSHLSNVVYKDIGVSDLNDSSYNTLFKDPTTWKFFLNLGISKVLVFQLDSLILKPTVHEFLHFDYVGAPWTVDNDVYYGVNEYGVKIPALPKAYRVGNGGLSLRSVEAMFKISSVYGNTSTPDEQEDVFFVRHLHELKYDVANVTTATRFAVEVPVEGVNFHDLFGIHQTWKYVSHATFLDILGPILNPNN